MELTLKFEPKDFESFKTFEKSVSRQVGNHIYVGSDSMCVYFDYPAALKEMLRPFPKTPQLEFNLVSSKP